MADMRLINRCKICPYRRTNNTLKCVHCISEHLHPIQFNSCPICLNTFYDPQYSECIMCRKLINNDQLFIKGVVSCSYYYGNSGTFGLICNSYKAAHNTPNRPHLGFVLQSLAYEFLSRHMRCIEGQYGNFDLLVPIPGHAESVYIKSSYGNRDVAKILIDQRPSGERYTSGAKRSITPDRFAVSTSVKNAKILLLDDTFTQGATTNSAGWTLINAGARDVTVFTVARYLGKISEEYLIIPHPQFNIEECIFCA